MKILILDDDEFCCLLLKTFFEKNNHIVFTANSLIEGLKMIDEHQPSVLFIDNFLPDGEGWKAAKTIKVKNPGLDINLMSAQDKSFFLLKDYEDAIWEKPISIQQLETYSLFINKSQPVSNVA